MKKLSVLIVIIIVAIVFGVAGYMIGVNSNTSSSAVGIYHSDSWNGHEATLVLNADDTCKYPTGDKGTWTIENNIIHINLGNTNTVSNDIDATSTATASNTTDIHDATIVKDGVILHDVMFQNMSK
ncbi:MAG TPA: hypothetical protein VHT96_03210 [Clostridia bacterium]|nr:hypothetical protein [Clostridia bacterium]